MKAPRAPFSVSKTDGNSRGLGWRPLVSSHARKSLGHRRLAGNALQAVQMREGYLPGSSPVGVTSSAPPKVGLGGASSCPGVGG
jgi:hypothetical protein